MPKRKKPETLFARWMNDTGLAREKLAFLVGTTRQTLDKFATIGLPEEWIGRFREMVKTNLPKEDQRNFEKVLEKQEGGTKTVVDWLESIDNRLQSIEGELSMAGAKRLKLKSHPSREAEGLKQKITKNRTKRIKTGGL